jgi:allene oxide cyclase
MMMRQMRSLAMFAVVAALIAHGLDGGVFAQDATPVTTSVVGNETLVVIDRSTTDTVIDLGEEGDSIGDLLAFGNAVYDEGNETEVGTNQGSCVRTVPGEAWECMFTIILDQGQLTVAGPLYDAGSSELAIIGGTGAYATARGLMRLEATSETESRFTFEIA